MSTEGENLSVVFEDFSEVDPRQVESHSAFVNWFYKQLSQIDTYGSVDKRVVVDAPFSIRTTDEHTIYFSYHTLGYQVNRYNVKESYVRGYYYIDALGYSGFSELSRLGSDEIDALVESIDANIAFNFVNDLSEQMRFKLGSKYKQPPAQEPELSFQKRKFPKDTVFFPLQLESDTVSFFQRFDITSAIFRVLFNVNEYQVVVKFHPLSRRDTRFYVILFSSFLFKRLKIYKGSIFDLLRDKVTVVTGNSGVGFEALFFGCPVITCSKSDYEYATISAKSCVDVIEALERGHRVPQEKIYKFLYFYLNRYCFSSSSDISGSTFAFPRFLAKKDLIEANHTVPFMEAFLRSQKSHRGDFKLYMRSILLNFLLFFREWFRK